MDDLLGTVRDDVTIDVRVDVSVNVTRIGIIIQSWNTQGCL